ncbi:transmembrane protein 54 isoform X7 [Balaenoptera musculus]|uniref:Transmembrane protein 54 isoform X7 n=1 Tax=Balaenoptera musculus TaxID=9771 RepID=A0A8B8VGJ7_BALMU|nr:transmembrane protein 54 isoform X7 [Balaenoptera musculus]
MCLRLVNLHDAIQSHGACPAHRLPSVSPRSGSLSVGDFRKMLMKTGLVLVVLGHVSFIAAALLHGTVLRYVAAPHDAVALQYCVVNILSVTSAIVVITSGIAVIVLSRYLPSIPLSSSLCLWGISLLFCVAESVFAVRSAQITHQLLELRPWLGKSSHHMEETQTQWAWQPLTSPQMRESPEPMEDHDLPSCTSSGLMTL